MATLRKNGEIITELTIYRSQTDGADGGIDEMRLDKITKYRAMTSGKILRKIQIISDYGTGSPAKKFDYGWKVYGKIKPELIKNKDFEGIRKGFFEWHERLLLKGLECEITI